MKMHSAALLLFAMALPAQAEDKITVVAFEYPPIYQDDKDKGLSGDLVAESFRAAGVDASFSFVPVKRMVQMLSSGQAVCGIGGAALFDTPTSKPHVTVVATINYVSQVFLYNIKAFPQGIQFDRLADLADYRIGALAGSGIHMVLAKDSGLKLVTNTVHDGTAKQLHQGRIDLWAIVDLTGALYMKRLFPDETADYRPSKAFNIGDVSLVCSKKLDPKGFYAAKFTDGLKIIKENGTYMRVMAKYYGGLKKVNKDSVIDGVK